MKPTKLEKWIISHAEQLRPMYSDFCNQFDHEYTEAGYEAFATEKFNAIWNKAKKSA